MDFRYLVVIVIVIVMAIVPTLLARKNEDTHSKTKKHSNCGNWTFGPCVLKDKASTCGTGKRIMIPSNENCPKKQKPVHCRIPCEAGTPASDCKYKKPKGVKGKDIPCDPITNQREVTMTLVKGDPSVCAPTKVISKECHKRQVRAVEAKKRRKTGERKQKQSTTAVAVVTEAATPASTVAPKDDAECRYQKGKSSKAPCDPVTNTRTVVKQLKKNAPASCEPTKTITESCQAKKSKAKKGGRKNAGHKNAEHKGDGD